MIIETSREYFSISSFGLKHHASEFLNCFGFESDEVLCPPPRYLLYMLKTMFTIRKWRYGKFLSFAWTVNMLSVYSLCRTRRFLVSKSFWFCFKIVGYWLFMNFDCRVSSFCDSYSMPKPREFVHNKSETLFRIEELHISKKISYTLTRFNFNFCKN